MADWGNDQGDSARSNTADDGWGNDSANDAGFGSTGFDGAEGPGEGQSGGDDKCFGCGETG